MRRAVAIAATGGTAATMLFAVATGGLAIVASDEDQPRAPVETTPAPEPRPAVTVVPLPGPHGDLFPDRPIVLPNGAPACGNVMAKYAAPVPIGDCAATRTMLYLSKGARVPPR